MAEKKHAGGRPTLYKKEYSELARKFCLLGATDIDLAKFFEVNVDTIHEWKKVHKEFSDSIKEGKEEADANVANRLYQRAMGYSHPDVHISNYQGEITVTPIVKEYAPDPTSAIFWLKNRQKDRWSDRVVHAGDKESPLVTQLVLSSNELLDRIRGDKKD